jgi:hypothetical protein
VAYDVNLCFIEKYTVDDERLPNHSENILEKLSWDSDLSLDENNMGDLLTIWVFLQMFA